MSELATVKSNYSSLSYEKQLVLKRLWVHLFTLWQIPIDNLPNDLFSDQQSNLSSGEENDTDIFVPGELHKEFKLLDLDPTIIHESFWNYLRLESPDCHLLRFLRARKFHLDKTIRMISKNFKFNQTHHLESLINQGEYHIISNQNDHEGLVKCIEKQKAVIVGHDRENRPIILVRPKFHYSSDQTEQELEKYALLIIETSRLFMKEGSITILFDLTDFSLSNMDYAPVKFIITCFEAHYPESLGSLIIHKAPWLFSPIWSIIKNWLDPVVASKIVFTKNTKDLNKLIDNQQLPTYLKGENDTVNLKEYVAPDGSQDVLLHVKEDDSDDFEYKRKMQILTKRKGLINKFQDTTIQWIKEQDELESNKLWNIKCEIGEELCQNYIELDPYIRSRSIYDINQTLKL